MGNRARSLMAALVLVGVPVLSGRAEFVVMDRLSELSFIESNLGVDDVEMIYEDIAAPFLEVIAGQNTDTEPSGAINSGIWVISQNTEILSDRISSENNQYAATTTDFGSPGVFTESYFELTFEVTASTSIALTGLLVGNTSPGTDDFCRVQLLKNGVPLFSSGTFPYLATLEPGNTYFLKAQVRGESEFNDSTASTANVTMVDLDAAAGCDGDANGDGVVDPLDAGYVLSRLGCPVIDGDLDCVESDVNGDGLVDPLDVGFVLSRFGDCYL